MKANIFTSTKNWKFTNNDQKAEAKFITIENQTRTTLPQSFYQRPLVHFQHIKSTHLYKLMKTIPKGVMHHTHYLCNEDQSFYKEYVLSDSRIYLSKSLDTFQVGTTQEAQQHEWISMQAGMQKYGEQQWLRRVVDLTCFTPQQLKVMNYKSKQTWQTFQKKIMTPLKIFFVKDIFQKYTKHMLVKFIKNGYDRIQIRLILQQLNEYDEKGKFIKKHAVKTYTQSLNQIISEINQQFPHFSFGAILVGFKALSDEMNSKAFRDALATNWDKIVGFDYVQEEDMFDSFEQFDSVINKILSDHPHLSHLKKVYHAGETNNNLTNNIDLAVKAGTVRLGHGINILQRTQFLPHCKHICFQKNPISNLLLGYKSDLRDSSAPILLGLGYPVSISPDDPGKFGLEDTTCDYFTSVVSYNWTLRHLKLIAYHSINHAICQEKVKHNLINSFQTSWDAWIADFLQNQHVSQSKIVYQEEDIFSNAPNWSFSQKEEGKDKLYSELMEKVVNNIPLDIYQTGFMAHKQMIKESALFKILKTMPKGTLQSCHFLTNHDLQFVKTYVIPNSSNIYLNEYSKQMLISTIEQSLKHSWTSLQKLRLMKDQQELAEYIYSLVSFLPEELSLAIGHQSEFWRIYSKKYSNLVRLLSSEHLFRLYARYALGKLAALNYQRVEFRIQPIRLTKYADNGEKLQECGYNQMITIINEQLQKVKLSYPSFDIGFIILGNKGLGTQQNRLIFDYFASSKWDKIIAFDLEQTVEDQCLPLVQYIDTIDQILLKYEELPIYRIYQAGNSNNHINSNIQAAINSGAFRITNGLNILQQISLLSKCKSTCFEVNPILNLCQGSSKRMDFRLGIAPILLGLGFPVTISSDLCGMLGLQNTIYDLYFSAISYNWCLKHLKLSIFHSINYSCITQGMRKLQLASFEQRWSQWIASI